MFNFLKSLFKPKVTTKSMTSIQLREWVKNHPHTLFSDEESDHADILSSTKTKDSLINMMAYLVNKGWIIYFTAINSDHHDDSALGLHSHHDGYAFDCWPMNSTKTADWIDANDYRFQKFLTDVSKAPMLYQIGLAGSALIDKNIIAAGKTYFEDDGADHVHIGVK